MTDFTWITIVVSFFGLVSAALIARATNRKSDREGADAIASAAVQLISPLEDRLEKVVNENRELVSRLEVLETESRELETLRFENQHLKDRIRYLEIQVEMLREGSTKVDVIEEKLLFERERSGTLVAAVGALASQVIGLGGEPVIELGETNVE